MKLNIKKPFNQVSLPSLPVKKCLIMLGVLCMHYSSNAQSPISWVDPLIGSGGHGHVFVGASVPFGAVQLGPQNFYKGWDWCSGYNYQDSVLAGFSYTHLSGTGIGDLGDILIMPYTGKVKLDKGQETIRGSGYSAHFSHENETVRPGYYSVLLDDSHIKVELTASERVGFHEYHFPEGKNAHVIIDLKEGLNDQATQTHIEQTDTYTLQGYRYSNGWAKNQWLFFAIKSSIPLNHFSVYDADHLLAGKSGSGKAIKGLISFDKKPGVLQLKVGISPVSSQNALQNIQSEIPRWDFDRVVKTSEQKWNKALSSITIKTKNKAYKKIFYTALYHTMIDPALFNDHNGDYRGTDKKVYRQAKFNNYSVFSFWDTYRACNPLYILTEPKRVPDMINSMLAINDQQGYLPIWHLNGNETGTMVGVSSRQVIAEAYLKGIRGFDPNPGYQALLNTSQKDTLGLQYDKRLQYIPIDKERRAVAKGLEYAIADESIARMAKEMGNQAGYQLFHKRAENYRLYFDQKDGFFKGRLSDGSFPKDFNPLRPDNNIYAEGNAWQYLWLVPQDVYGLINLLGGQAAFNARLDAFFQIQTPATEKKLVDLTGLIGQYAHGNEPSHHIAYLYSYSGQQWKTAEKVRYIMENFYHDKPDGIIGNEDCGQMSAWYVFSAMGIYPVFPASTQYVFGSPLMDAATIHLGNGKSFVIIAKNNDAQHPYIQRILLNGHPYTKGYITHQQILRGGTLTMVMGKKPNKNFAVPLNDRPGQTKDFKL